MTKAITCDYCGAAWPRENPYVVHVEMEVATYRTPSEQDFCNWECLAKYAAERERKAIAGVSQKGPE